MASSSSSSALPPFSSRTFSESSLLSSMTPSSDPSLTFLFEQRVNVSIDSAIDTPTSLPTSTSTSLSSSSSSTPQQSVSLPTASILSMEYLMTALGSAPPTSLSSSRTSLSHPVSLQIKTIADLVFAFQQGPSTAPEPNPPPPTKEAADEVARGYNEVRRYLITDALGSVNPQFVTSPYASTVAQALDRLLVSSYMNHPHPFFWYQTRLWVFSRVAEQTIPPSTTLESLVKQVIEQINRSTLHFKSIGNSNLFALKQCEIELARMLLPISLRIHEYANRRLFDQGRAWYMYTTQIVPLIKKQILPHLPDSKPFEQGVLRAAGSAIQLEQLKIELSTHWETFFPPTLVMVKFVQVQSLTPHQILRLCFFNFFTILIRNYKEPDAIQKILDVLQIDFLHLHELLSSAEKREALCKRAKTLLKMPPNMDLTFDRLISLSHSISQMCPAALEQPLTASAALDPKAEKLIFSLFHGIMPKWKHFVSSLPSSIAYQILTLKQTQVLVREKVVRDSGAPFTYRTALALANFSCRRNGIIAILQNCLFYINRVDRLNPTASLPQRQLTQLKMNSRGFENTQTNMSAFMHSLTLMQSFWHGVPTAEGSVAESHVNDYLNQQKFLFSTFFRELAEGNDISLAALPVSKQTRTFIAELFERFIKKIIIPTCVRAQEHFMHTYRADMLEESSIPTDLWENIKETKEFDAFLELKPYLKAEQRHYFCCCWQLYKRVFDLALRFSQSFTSEIQLKEVYTLFSHVQYAQRIVMGTLLGTVPAMISTFKETSLSSTLHSFRGTLFEFHPHAIEPYPKSIKTLMSLEPLGCSLKTLGGKEVTEKDSFLEEALQSIFPRLFLYTQFLNLLSMKVRIVTSEQIDEADRAYESLLVELEEEELNEAEDSVEEETKEAASTSSKKKSTKVSETELVIPPPAKRPSTTISKSIGEAERKLTFSEMISHQGQTLWRLGGINSPIDLARVSGRHAYMLKDYLFNIERVKEIALAIWQSRSSASMAFWDRKLKLLGHQALDNLLGFILKHIKPSARLKHDTHYLWSECGLKMPEAAPQLRFWMEDNALESVTARYKGRYPEAPIKRQISRQGSLRKFLGLVTLTATVWEKYYGKNQSTLIEEIHKTVYRMAGYTFEPKKESRSSKKPLPKREPLSSITLSSSSSSSSHTPPSSSSSSSHTPPPSASIKGESSLLKQFLQVQIPKKTIEIAVCLKKIQKNLNSPSSPQREKRFIEKQLVSIDHLLSSFSRSMSDEFIAPQRWGALFFDILFSTHYIAENTAAIIAKKHGQMIVGHQLQEMIPHGFGRQLSKEAMATLQQIKDISTADLRPFHYMHKYSVHNLSIPIKLLLDLTCYSHHMTQWPDDEGCVDCDGKPISRDRLEERFLTITSQLLNLRHELVEKELPAAITL